MGLQWSFPKIEVLAFSEGEAGEDAEDKFVESEYFEKRKSEFVIEFKKEPPKSSSQCFEVSISIFYIYCFRIVDLQCSKERTGDSLCRSSIV